MIDTVSSSGGVTNNTSAGGAYGANNLGKEDFLKLLVAQLRNQDPMKPVEDKEFIAQLAQFNALEQMQNLNTAFMEMIKWQQLSQSSALIGKKIDAVEAGEQISGTVSEVRISMDGPVLKVGERDVSLGSITRIY